MFLVRKSATIAKLRLLIVEPKARGLGLGKHLVAECLRFAQASGYREVTLWTQENLLAARRIYQQAGFTLAGRESHALFGVPLVGETWNVDARCEIHSRIAVTMKRSSTSSPMSGTRKSMPNSDRWMTPDTSALQTSRPSSREFAAVEMGDGQ